MQPQVSLWREDRPLPIVAVHDESGTYGKDRYFITGFVFVGAPGTATLLEALRAARIAEDYWREIHYERLTETTGRWGSKYRTACRWLEAFEEALRGKSARACVLAVDCRTDGYRHEIFRNRPHWAYNRFTRMALESGIRWFYPRHHALTLRLISDEKSRRPGGDDEEPAAGDNFVTYLPRITARRAATQAGWPDVRFVPPLVEVVQPDKEEVHRDCSDACELAQLTDLVVSGFGAALRGPSTKQSKRDVARRVADWTICSRAGPKGRRIDLFRRFSASLFRQGELEAWPRRFAIRIDPRESDGQESLFE